MEGTLSFCRSYRVFFLFLFFFVFDVREMSETWFIEEVKHQRGISSQGERMIYDREDESLNFTSQK